MDEPLRVFTTAFRVERFLTHIFDIVWGREVPIVRGLGLLFCLFVEAKIGLLGLPGHLPVIFQPFAWALILGINVVVWNLIGRPQVQRRPVWFWALAEARYWLTEPRFFVGPGLRAHERHHQRLHVHAWSHRP